jgi:TolA-binding protein
MLKVNIIFLLLALTGASVWFYYSNKEMMALEASNEPTVKEVSTSDKEEIGETGEEIRRLHKKLKLQEKEIERLNSDILKIERKFTEFLTRIEQNETNVSAHGMRISNIEQTLESGSATFKKIEVPETTLLSHSRYSSTPQNNPLTPAQAIDKRDEKTVPFPLLLRVASLNENQKTQYRELIIEHNKTRTEIIKSKGGMNNQEMQVKLKSHQEEFQKRFLNILEPHQQPEFDGILKEYYDRMDKNRELREERRNRNAQPPPNPQERR